MLRLAHSLLASVVAVALLAPSALADADPASDFLLAQNVFYPYSPTVSTGLQERLNAEATAAHRAHFPVRVALIGSRSDLGAIPYFIGRPQQYAHFLEQEISYYDGNPPLLVVMHGGYGSERLDPASRAALSALKPPAGTDSNALAEAAVAALPKLAAAAGHPFQVSGADGVAAGGGPGAIAVVAVFAGASALAAAILAVRRLRAR